MAWPQRGDYLEALQHPTRCFHDAELRRGRPAGDARGRPVCRTGAVSDVFEIRCAADRWAVKCYQRELPELLEHYQTLRGHLLRLNLPCFVEAQYLLQGIEVRGRWYPVVKMRWVDGQPLNDFVRDYADEPWVLGQVAERWLQLARDLRGAVIAHGNLQHDHIFVSREGLDGPLTLKLLDYDGVFVPATAGSTPHEAGHPNYEHPQRVWQKSYDVEIDRFAQLVIYTALQALSAGGRELWLRYDIGTNLLFRETDFQEPATSALLHDLWRMQDAPTRGLVGHLILAGHGPLAGVPRLDELLLILADRQRHSETGLPLTPGQVEQVEAILGHEPPPEIDLKKKTRVFSRDELDTELGKETDDNFDLVVDSESEVALPPLPEPVVPKSAPIAAGPPPLLTEAEPADFAPAYDPTACDYHLDAWMPERVAVVKLRGFVDAHFGEIVTSVPGLVRVRMLNPFTLAQPRGAGLRSWFGLADAGPARPRTRAFIEIFMQHKETEFQKLLAMTIRVKPGDDDFADKLEWQRFCDQVFCELRGHLMGK